MALGVVHLVRVRIRIRWTRQFSVSVCSTAAVVSAHVLDLASSRSSWASLQLIRDAGESSCGSRAARRNECKGIQSLTRACLHVRLEPSSHGRARAVLDTRNFDLLNGDASIASTKRHAGRN